jgi:hypothetical protein
MPQVEHFWNSDVFQVCGIGTFSCESLLLLLLLLLAAAAAAVVVAVSTAAFHFFTADRPYSQASQCISIQQILIMLSHLRQRDTC